MRRRCADLLILGLLLALAGCSTLSGRGVGDCQDRVAAKIKRDHPQSRGSSFDSGTVNTRRDGDRVSVTGAGEVRTKDGDRRRFTFSCVYNDRTGKVGNVSYNVK